MLGSLGENWILKLISLIFALVLWFFVMGEKRQEVGFPVPLKLENIPEGLMVANEVPSLVDVRISGPRTVLVNVKQSDISLSIDLKGLQPGVTTFRRLEERLNLPSVLKVTRLSPSYVDIKLERIKDREVPVRVAFTGSLPQGYTVESLSTDPPAVVVEGAESELKGLNEVQTEPIDMTGVRESFSLMTPLDYAGRFTSLKSVRSVEVDVKIVGPPPAPGDEMSPPANPNPKKSP